VTYYFALSISTGALMTFGLEGKSLGTFLVIFNSIIVVLVGVFAWIGRKKYLRQCEQKESMVRASHKIFFKNIFF
jgi:hypothetical protein